MYRQGGQRIVSIMKRALILFFSLTFAFSIFAQNNIRFEKVLTHHDIIDITDIYVRNIDGNISVERSDTSSLSILIISEDPILNRLSDSDFWERSFNVRIENSILSMTVQSCDDDKSQARRGKRNVPSLDILVKIPASDYNMTLETINGNIVSKKDTKDIYARSVNGDIHLGRGHGIIDISSVNGNIKLSILEINGPSFIKSVNGDITVKIAEDLGVFINAGTIAGSIKIDGIDLQNPVITATSLKGTLNKDTYSLSVCNVKGKIYLTNFVDIF